MALPLDSDTASSLSDPDDQLLIINKNQLWTLLKALAFNLTADNSPHDVFAEGSTTTTPLFPDSTINSTTTNEDLSLRDAQMLVYIAVFFLWYGGVIFVCLIGFGVYKKKGHDVYRNFVERRDIKEALKKLKEKERERKKLIRMSSFASFNSSVFPTSDSCHSPDHAYLNSFTCSAGNRMGKLLTQIPSAQSDEEERLMETTDTLQNFTPNNSLSNGQVKFLV